MTTEGTTDEAALFLRRFEQLQAVLAERNVDRLLELPVILRQLLVDGNSLMHLANRTPKMLIRFCPRRSSRSFIDALAKTSVPSPQWYWTDLAQGSESHELKLAQFLAHPAVFGKGQHFTVREVIDTCANKLGGVHFQSAKNDDARTAILREMNQQLNFGGPAIFRTLASVAEVSVDALTPLYVNLRLA